MRHSTSANLSAWALVAAVLSVPLSASAAEILPSYYAHPAATDGFGVIAPWYKGLNGQLDQRVGIAVDVYKRYPWVGTDKAVMAAPDFVYNSHWRIRPDGTIEIPPTTDWMCGDLSQRAWSIIKGLTAYYAYSGDPIAFLYIPLTVDYVLDYGLTPKNHPWPEFPISTPTNGKAYGKCDPNARNQLDLCAMLGIEVLRAYKLTGNPRYLKAAKHWGDLFAKHCRFDIDESPWDRYVDPSVVDWADILTGSTSCIVDFLNDLIAVGYAGENRAIVKARDRGREFMRDKMLPLWLVNDTWGRSYWDWDNPIICGNVSVIGDYFERDRGFYPMWKTDLRNILMLIANRNSADPVSVANTYSGAWAWPESSVCCGTSLSYCQYTAGPTLIRLGVLAGDEWAKEIGRRMMIMATYDSLNNGVVKDGIFGDQVATAEWSNLAHPWPLCQAIEAMGWLPREFGPNRENHIMRSSSVVNRVLYEKGRIGYSTFDAPKETVDVLRLAFKPRSVRAGGDLHERTDLHANGYTLEALGNGDFIVRIRHDGKKSVVVEGDDPQKAADDAAFDFQGRWSAEKDSKDLGGAAQTTTEAGASATFPFTGNQVRLLGTVRPDGGWADAYVDGEKQLTVVEFWNPVAREQQPVFVKKGLSNGPHVLKIVARGVKSTVSQGTAVTIDGAQYSSATGEAGYGSGGGPTGPQRMIFGFNDRKDFVDSKGNAWRPATEFIVRTGGGTDTVEKTWWTRRRTMWIGNTGDPEIYRYGVHAKDFTVNLTVGPGTYDVTLKFADCQETPWMEREDGWNRIVRPTSVAINGQTVIDSIDIPKAAGGLFRAVDRTFRGVQPKSGIIEIRFQGVGGHEAMIQAIELTPSK